MKKLLFAIIILLGALSTSAQVRIGVQADSAKMAEYREQIGLDMSVPDFEVKKIDDKKMGTRLANLLCYFEENYSQGSYNRWITSVLRERIIGFSASRIRSRHRRLLH